MRLLGAWLHRVLLGKYLLLRCLLLLRVFMLAALIVLLLISRLIMQLQLLIRRELLPRLLLLLLLLLLSCRTWPTDSGRGDAELLRPLTISLHLGEDLLMRSG